MELFRNDGHLTDEGLQAVIDGTLDEMGRLEAAEHLGFCDECLVRYTALLTGEVLIAPETPIKEGVAARIKKRARRILWSKYGTVAAAAVLAVAMFSIGSIFTMPRLVEKENGKAGKPQTTQSQQATPEPKAEAQEAPREGIADRLDNALNSATSGINNFFSGLIPGSSAAPAEDPDRQERDKHNELFANKNKPDDTTNQNDNATGGSTAAPDSGTDK